MAITGFWPIKDNISRVIDYAVNPEKTIAPEDMSDDLKKVIRYTSDPGKTDKLMYVSALNCPWQQTYEWMTATKKRYGKLGGNTCYHGFQSFYGKEVSPEEAHALGMETARRMWGDEYEVLVTTHLNTGNVHNHFVVNSVSFRTGRKYENHKRDHQRLREVSDELCREHGLYVIENPRSHGLSFAEWRAHKDGILTMKERLALDMKECLDFAISVPHFYQLMERMGYTVDRRGKYPSFLPKDGKRPLRLKEKGKSLTEADIERLLDESFENQPETIVIPKMEKPFVPYQKQHGFMALVYWWMYALGLIGKGKKIPYRIDREEVRKFNRYKRLNEFIIEYRIDTWEQLYSRRDALIERQTELAVRRNELRRNQRRTGDKDPEIAEITAELRRIRRELRICGELEADIPKMQRAFDADNELRPIEHNYEYER
jgi:hypothetical protein